MGLGSYLRPCSSAIPRADSSRSVLPNPNIVKSRVGPPAAQTVQIEHGRGCAQGKHGVLGVVRGTQKTGLGAGGGEEHDGAVRRRLRAYEGLRQSQEAGGPGGIVNRPIENVVPRERRVVAQMVPVGRIKDILATAAAAGQQRDDI